MTDAETPTLIWSWHSYHITCHSCLIVSIFNDLGNCTKKQVVSWMTASSLSSIPSKIDKLLYDFNTMTKWNLQVMNIFAHCQKDISFNLITYTMANHKKCVYFQHLNILLTIHVFIFSNASDSDEVKTHI